MNRSGLNVPDVRDVTVYVYALCSPGGEVRYIGRSANPRYRLCSHAHRSGARAVRNWIREIRRRGKEPSIRILREVAPGDDAAQAEGEEIAAHRGHRLLNRRFRHTVAA